MAVQTDSQSAVLREQPAVQMQKPPVVEAQPGVLRDAIDTLTLRRKSLQVSSISQFRSGVKCSSRNAELERPLAGGASPGASSNKPGRSPFLLLRLCVGGGGVCAGDSARCLMSGDASVERMWKVLSKHGSVERKTVTQTPKAELPPLKWHRAGEWAMESDDKRYRISKVLVKGIAHYQAYSLPPGGEWWFCLTGDCESFEAAKAVVERHRKQP